MPIKTLANLGLLEKIRVGRETGNTHIFFGLMPQLDHIIFKEFGHEWFSPSVVVVKPFIFMIVHVQHFFFFSIVYFVPSVFQCYVLSSSLLEMF